MYRWGLAGDPGSGVRTNRRMEKVELNPAFHWNCGRCGHQNFSPALIIKDPEVISEMRQQHGIPEEEAGNFQFQPPTVTCSHCGKQFETIL